MTVAWEFPDGRVIHRYDETFPRSWVKEINPHLTARFIAELPDPVTMEAIEEQVATWAVERKAEFAEMLTLNSAQESVKETILDEVERQGFGHVEHLARDDGIYRFVFADPATAQRRVTLDVLTDGRLASLKEGFADPEPWECTPGEPSELATRAAVEIVAILLGVTRETE